MPKRIDLTGQVVGRLTVTGLSHVTEQYVAYWDCMCQCGVATKVTAHSLIHRRIKSCGCLHRESAGNRVRTHGWSKTNEYHIWANIKSRCGDETNRYYGTRGIAMAEEWKNDFGAFLAHMGPRPSKRHSVERLDNSRGYEPGNCKWALPIEQARNKRSNHLITINGVTKTLVEWSEQTGVSTALIFLREKNGRSGEELIAPPRTIKVDRRTTAITHGLSFTPEYEAWHRIKTDHRGSMCAAWIDSPDTFIVDVGPRPTDDHVLLIKDTSKPYEPGNVEWVTRKEKQRRLPTNKFVALDGVSKTVAGWAEEFGIEQRRLAQRLRQGWELKAALTTPFGMKQKTLATGA